MDSQGRILVPPQLREAAHLRRDVVIVGVLDKIEIWSRERWAQFSAQERDPEDYAAKLAELGIRI